MHVSFGVSVCVENVLAEGMYMCVGIVLQYMGRDACQQLSKDRRIAAASLSRSHPPMGAKLQWVGFHYSSA